MDDKEAHIRRLYENFKWWLGIHYPSALMALMAGSITPEQLKPKLRDWAKDITHGK